ncbi:MAG TPA: hypothetical protein VGV88_12095 [Candidatus Dormibacteraeota bacterium]|nr:hypothetical protein [Candidatus Dormibacteraeota bacterium]
MRQLSAGLLGLLVGALLLGGEAVPAPATSPPLVGFSFSPAISTYLNRDPATDLSTLLTETDPDLVRLPVYWDLTEASPGTLDFALTDLLLDAVAAHNLISSRPTRVVLTVGARNFLYPELHEPAWAGPRQQPELGLAQEGGDYQQYFEATLLRYRTSPLLYAWQIENEPFDYVANESTGDDQITPDQVEWEIAETHQLDPDHRAVTTTFDGWNVIVDWLQEDLAFALEGTQGYPSGHPAATLQAGDALGLDLYVDGPSTPFRFASVALRTSWKAEAVRYWSAVAKSEGKDMWLTEVQAQPWASDPGEFTTSDLLVSAKVYRSSPVQVVLLWGVETWLADPAWMQAAIQAMGVLRTPSAGLSPSR